MLYLAEVVQKRGLMGSKGELKLLACQKGDQWNGVNEPAIATDEAGNYKDGSLVLVEVAGSGGDRRCQRIQEGARQIVTLLQSYSRQQEKSKSKEEEIQQWMESLTFQSQELNRREMEMESRREELEQIEQEIKNLERQRQEVGRLNQEIEHKNQELKQAWDQLRGEQQRVKQERDQIEQSPSIDPQQAQTLQTLVQQVAEGGGDASSLRPAVETCLQIADTQGAILMGRWDAVEAEKQSLGEIQDWVETEVRALGESLDQWREDTLALVGEQCELKAKRTSLQFMEGKRDNLSARIQGQEQLRATLEGLASGEVSVSERVNIAELEGMELGALEGMVSQLKQDFDKMSRFVSDQEEELGYQRQTIEEVQEKMRQAGEFDRIAMEPELADEKEHYDRLNESLLGSRRNLNEREEVFHIHESVLRKRQGLSPKNADGAIDLTPVIGGVNETVEKLQTELQSVEETIAKLTGEVETIEANVTERKSSQDTTWHELQGRAEQLHTQQVTLGELRGKLGLTDEVLQPVQEQLDGVREHLQALLGNLEGAGGPSEAQQGAIAQIQSIVASLAQ